MSHYLKTNVISTKKHIMSIKIIYINIILTNFKNRIRKQKQNLELKVTPGENIWDALIKAGIKTAEESGYAAGNMTEKLVNIASSSSNIFNLGTKLTLGGESATALGTIAFKMTKDVIRGDTNKNVYFLVHEQF